MIATHFMESVCPMVVGIHRDQDFIINMSQSPIPFTFDRQRTLEVAGVCTVCIRKSTCDTKRATLAITITGISVPIHVGVFMHVSLWPGSLEW